MSNISEIDCLLCHNTGPAELVSSKLRDDNSGQHKVYRCLTCGHVQIFPLPDQEENVSFYDHDMQTKNLMGKTDFELLREKAKFDTERRVELVKDLLPDISNEGGGILDIGCGYGFFVDQLTKQGYQVFGIDLSLTRVALAKERCCGYFEKRKVDQGFINFNCSKFNMVTMFHVLEHLYEPEAFIKECMELLKPGGVLLIEVPNLADELLSHSKGYRDFYWQRAHLSYFDPARLELLILKTGCYEYNIWGVQRYGLRNLLNWVDEGKPQITNPDYAEQNLLISKYENIIKQKREELLTSDTLLAEIRK